MAEAVGSLRVDVAANVAQIKDDMGKVKSAIANGAAGIRGSLDGINTSANRTANAMDTLRTGAILMVAKKLAALTAQTLEYGAETDRTAKKLGITAESFQRLQYAASQTGVSSDTLTAGLQAVALKITELNAGSEEGAARLAALGVKISDLRNKRADEAFSILADRINAIQNPAYKSAAAIEVFGSSADKIMELVKQGSAGLSKFSQEADRFGVVLDQATLDKASEANKELIKLGKAFEAAGTKMTAELLPAMKSFRELITSPGFQNTVGVIASGISTIADKIFSGMRVMTEPQLQANMKLIADLSKQIEELDAQVARSEQGLQDAQGRNAGVNEINAITALMLKAVEDREELNKKLLDVQQESRDIASGKYVAPYGADRFRPTAHDKHATGANVGTDGPAAPVDVNKIRAYQKALEDLRFKTADAQDAFKGLAPGTAEAAKGLDIFNEAARKAYVETGKLPPQVRALNEAQLKLAGALLTREMMTPLETYGRELEKVKLLLDSGAISQDTYNRKVYQLKENFIAAGGAGISIAEMAKGIGDAFSRSFEQMIFDGKNWRDTLVSFAQDVAREILRASVTKPIANSIANGLGGSGGLLSTIFSADGNVFNNGRVSMFANGGVIGGPIAFPLASGMGIAGEAGPEAIVPLERGPDGKLGVSNSGGGSSGNRVHIDARGSDAGVADRIMRGMAQLEKGRPSPVSQLQAYKKRFPTR